MDAHALRERALTRVGALAASPRGPVVMSAVLVAALAWQLADVTWRLLPETEAPATVAMASTSRAPQDSGDSAAAPAMRVAGMHLFGTPPANEPAPEVTEAPETQLDLTLKGLFVAWDGGGSAIISVGGRAEDVYVVGDTLVGDTTITAIRRDGVIIRRGGSPEVLRMEHAPRARRARTRQSQGQPDRAAAARQLRQRFVEDPASLPRQIRFEPAVREGKLVGYRIASRTNDISLASFGLEPTDVVTSVNGVPLNDPRQASGVLASLRDAQSVEIGFLRGGRTHRMAIPIGAPG